MSFVIKSTSDKSQIHLNCIVFGDYKVGKTRLAGNLKSLVISVEDGTLSLADAKDCDFIQLKTATEILAFYKHINDNLADFQKKYDWIFLDTVTELGQNIYPALRDKMTKEAIENGSKGADGRQVWGKFGEIIGKVVKELRALPFHTCVLAHPAEKEDEEGLEKRSPDIYGKSGSRIVGWLDEVFYMHINKEGKEVFLTQATERTIAGDRSGKLDKIEKADLAYIQKKILG